MTRRKAISAHASSNRRSQPTAVFSKRTSSFRNIKNSTADTRVRFLTQPALHPDFSPTYPG